MNLTMEYTMTCGKGKSPQAVHDRNNLLRVFYISTDNTVHFLQTEPKLGLYDDLFFKERGRGSPDENVSLPSLKRVAHYGAYGFWSAEGDHKFVIYMMPSDISKALTDGSITFNSGSEVSSASCTFANIMGELLNRNRALVTPGAKIEIYFSLGGKDEIPMGTFYVDRSSVSYPDENVSVSARNAIGKLLKEQTFDENVTFEKGSLQDNIAEILDMAGVEQYFVGDPDKVWKLRFEPDVSLLDGINRVICLLPDWKVAESASGMVGVGKESDPRFDQPGIYTFVRDKTCWSYQIEYDDSEAASKVCVFTEDNGDIPGIKVYKDVQYNKWWVQPPHRTLYVSAAKGATLADVTALADELAQTLAITGRLETFVGIFTPQLTLGDEVHVIDEKGDTEVVGTLTDVTHNFGKNGFYTSFTVDSGGRRTRTRLSDLINKATTTANTDGVEIY